MTPPRSVSRFKLSRRPLENISNLSLPGKEGDSSAFNQRMLTQEVYLLRKLLAEKEQLVEIQEKQMAHLQSTLIATTRRSAAVNHEVIGINRKLQQELSHAQEQRRLLKHDLQQRNYAFFALQKEFQAENMKVKKENQDLTTAMLHMKASAQRHNEIFFGEQSSSTLLSNGLTEKIGEAAFVQMETGKVATTGESGVDDMGESILRQRSTSIGATAVASSNYNIQRPMKPKTSKSARPTLPVLLEESEGEASSESEAEVSSTEGRKLKKEKEPKRSQEVKQQVGRKATATWSAEKKVRRRSFGGRGRRCSIIINVGSPLSKTSGDSLPNSGQNVGARHGDVKEKAVLKCEEEKDVKETTPKKGFMKKEIVFVDLTTPEKVEESVCTHIPAEVPSEKDEDLFQEVKVYARTKKSEAVKAAEKMVKAEPLEESELDGKSSTNISRNVGKAPSQPAQPKTTRRQSIKLQRFSKTPIRLGVDLENVRVTQEVSASPVREERARGACGNVRVKKEESVSPVRGERERGEGMASVNVQEVRGGREGEKSVANVRVKQEVSACPVRGEREGGEGIANVKVKEEPLMSSVTVKREGGEGIAHVKVKEESLMSSVTVEREGGSVAHSRVKRESPEREVRVKSEVQEDSDCNTISRTVFEESVDSIALTVRQRRRAASAGVASYREPNLRDKLRRPT